MKKERHCQAKNTKKQHKQSTLNEVREGKHITCNQLFSLLLTNR